MLLVLGTLAHFQESDAMWVTKMLRIEIQNEMLKSYSGCYEMDVVASKHKKNYKRHVYTNTGGGLYNASFGYCSKRRRWLLHSHVTDATDACSADDSELAYSAKSFSFDLSTVFDEGWFSASGTPLDLYFVQFDKDQEGNCELFDDGICHNDFNTFQYQYDGGDCCSATCSHSICGVWTVTEAFGVTNASGNGFPGCEDPSMVPITIHLKNFTSSRAPENLVKRYSNERIDHYLFHFSDNHTGWYSEDPVKPSLRLDCDGRMALLVDISNDMEDRKETVLVNDGADCTITLENKTSLRDDLGDSPIWYATYTMYHRNQADKEIKILEANSGEEGKSSFVRIPTCVFEMISEYFDPEQMYINAPSILTLNWMLADTKGVAACDDEYFLDRYVLGLMHFGAPPLENGARTRWIQPDQQCLWSTIKCKDGSLSDLSLESLNLQGTIATAIGLLTDLSRISMTFNFLTGDIPSDIRSLTKLEYLDFDENILHGSIFVMESLTVLRSLSFYDNILSGKIPSDIKFMSKLTTIDVGNNFLSGQIPKEIGNLTNLKNLLMSKDTWHAIKRKFSVSIFLSSS